MESETSSDETHAGAEHFCGVVRSSDVSSPDAKVLVAGCGRGHEAFFIRKELDLEVVGVDVAEHWDPLATWGADVPKFDLRVSSVLELPFPDSAFDIVFYHHVIEHVSDPAASLRELSRVLKPGGLIYVGTPNRHRAVGYLGSFDASAPQKLQWNLNDYKARLRGRFRNEDGAHAGFSEKELLGIMSADFDRLRVLTSEYLVFKYGKRLPETVLKVICSPGIRGVAAPSVYVLGRNAKRSAQQTGR